LFFAIFLLVFLLAIIAFCSSHVMQGTVSTWHFQLSKEDEYGALVVIASPNNYIEGELQRLKLAQSEIRANLVQTKDGPRLYVFERDEKIARAVLKS